MSRYRIATIVVLVVLTALPHPVLAWDADGGRLHDAVVETAATTAAESGPTDSAGSKDAAFKFTDSINSSMQVITSNAWVGVEDSGPFNPDNALLKLPWSIWTTELRPDFKAQYSDCALIIKPRLRFTHEAVADNTDESLNYIDTFLNTGFIKCKLGEAWDVSVGSMLLLWGSSQWRSPSNPFFTVNERFNPALELLGKNFITLSYQPSLAWQISYIGNIGDYIGNIRGLDNLQPYFRPIQAVRVNWTGETTSAGTIVSRRSDRPLRWGAYGTMTWSDSTLYYGEFTTSRDAEGYLPERLDNGELVMTPARKVSDKWRYSATAGMQYTFENGLTLNLEYLRSTEGFNDRQARQWRELGRDINSALEGTGNLAALSQVELAVNPGWRQLGNQYLFAQLSRSEFMQRADLALRYIYNLEENSSALAASVAISLGPNWQLFSFASNNFGGGETEFGYLAHYSFQIGMRWYAL